MSHHKDYTGAKLGMWLFLFTEILLFGGLFLLYAAYLYRYPVEFHKAGQELSVLLGGANTVVLITSSWFVAMAISALQQGKIVHSKRFLLLTIACALIFMVNKYFEWSAKFEYGLYPNAEVLLARPNGEVVLFGLYYLMTGLHGLHVVLGGALLGFVYWKISIQEVTPTDFVLLENAGLYWHLVDLVWIYLFPLLYLIT